MKRSMEDGWMEDSWHCFCLGSEGDIRRIRIIVEAKQSIEYHPRQGNIEVFFYFGF